MDSLQTLKIIYCIESRYREGSDSSDDGINFGWDFPLPSKLPNTLTTCTWTNMHESRLEPLLTTIGTVGFSSYGDKYWGLSQASSLFRHPTLRLLKILRATSLHGIRTIRANESHVGTNLASLCFIDCKTKPVDLSKILRLPTALQYLTIASDQVATSIHIQVVLNCRPFFDAIQKSPTGETLEGLRLDMTQEGYVVVPAPGLHKMNKILYLEEAPEHIEANEQILLDLPDSPVPGVDCLLEHLLPISLEVLKISPDAVDFPILTKILERKAEITPRPRKIILSLNYRSQKMREELVTAMLQSDEDMESPFKDNSFFYEEYPCQEEKHELRQLRGFCEEKGVELMLLYEDSMRRKVLKEGAGPAVWEIEDQVK
jgi:hypothetical protein